MDDVKNIVTAIKNKDLKPVYFLMGEEPYYIDKISEFIENTVLDESEKGFNQMALYGRDISVDDIVSNAKRFPMMAEHQVVIVKEAQDLSRTIDALSAYVQNPQPSTILVINYKYKTLDKRKSLYKTLKKSDAVIFESKKLYDNQVPDWIRRVLKGNGYDISPKAAQMLTEFLGTDLGKINNELEKLKIILPKGTTISPEHIEENIGISKDFNVFELQKAIGFKDVFRAQLIVKYFGENPKSHPLPLIIPNLFSYFNKLLILHGLKDQSKFNAAKVLKVNPYFVDDYLRAIHNYPMRKVSQIISLIRTADVNSKGVNIGNVSNGDVLKELVSKIMN